MDLKIENGVLYGEDWDGYLRDEDTFPLQTLILPEGVTKIKAYAFEGNKWISKVVIPGTVKVIEEHAFSYCKNLSEVEIREGVERIEESAFEGSYCPFGGIKLPQSSLKFIGDSAFEDSGVEELGSLQGLEYIGSRAFAGCRLTQVCIPGTVKVVSPHAFRRCRELETVVLQEGVEEIGEGAFDMCGDLLELSLPASLLRIGKEAFMTQGGDYTDPDSFWPKFLLPSREVVIEDIWIKDVVEMFHLYK